MVIRLLFIALSLWCSVAIAADPKPNSYFKEPVFLEIDLHDSDIKQFIAWAAGEMGKDYAIAHDVEALITVKTDRLHPSGLEGFFGDVLDTYGYTYESLPQFIRVIKKPVIIEEEDLLVNQEEETPVIKYLVKTYDLKSAKSSDAFKVIEGLLQTISVSDKTGRASAVIQSSSQNMLIVSAPLEIQQEVESVIQRIDQVRKQIEIEAVLYDTTDLDQESLGIQFNHTEGEFKISNTTPLSLSASGLSAGILQGSDFSLLIKALQGNSKNRILSTPRIIIEDRSQGKIVVGQNVPFITGQSTSSGSDTENPFQTIERHDVGVKLTVTPHVTPDNNITLVVTQEASSVSDDSFASDIITNERRLDTTVTVEDGNVVYLGGLISKEVRKSHSGVPYLSAIPFIGFLFDSKEEKVVDTKLSVYLKATIVDFPGAVKVPQVGMLQ